MVFFMQKFKIWRVSLLADECNYVFLKWKINDIVCEHNFGFWHNTFIITDSINNSLDGRNFLLQNSSQPASSDLNFQRVKKTTAVIIFSLTGYGGNKSGLEFKNSYFLHWNFDWKSCFVVFFLEWGEWKNPQFNFSSQNLSIERNFFKWDGKETKILFP